MKIGWFNSTSHLTEFPMNRPYTPFGYKPVFSIAENAKDTLQIVQGSLGFYLGSMIIGLKDGTTFGELYGMIDCDEDITLFGGSPDAKVPTYATVQAIKDGVIVDTIQVVTAGVNPNPNDTCKIFVKEPYFFRVKCKGLAPPPADIVGERNLRLCLRLQDLR